MKKRPLQHEPIAAAVAAAMLLFAVSCGRSPAREREPNNSFDTANELAAGRAVEGFFNAPDDADYYRLVVDDDMIADIDLSLVRGVNHSIKVWQGAESPRLVRYIDDGRKSSAERMCNLSLARGVYFLSVQHGEKDDRRENIENPYLLKVTLRERAFHEEYEPNDEPSAASPLQFGIETGGFYSPGYNRYGRNSAFPFREEDWYYLDIDVNSGAIVLDVDLSGVADVNGALYVYDQALNELAACDAGGAGEGETARGIGIASPGRYYLMVASNAYHTQCAVPYRLHVARREYDRTSEIEPNNDRSRANLIEGGEMRGVVHPRGDLDFFLVKNGPDQKVYFIEALPPAGLDIALDVFSESGGKLCAVNNSAAGQEEIIPNLYAGRNFFVAVYSKTGGGDDSAPYLVKISSSRLTDGAEMEPNNSRKTATPVTNGPITGYSSSRKDVDYYKLHYPGRTRKHFRASAGQGAEIKVSVTDPLGYVIRTEEVKGEEVKSFHETIDGRGYVIVETVVPNYREPYTIELGD